MLDIISVGSISVDFYYKDKSLTKDKNRFHLAIGGKYQTEFFHISIGGGGANVAIGCSKLGLKAALLSTIGDNIFKKFIIETLKKHHISIDLCDIVEDYYNVSSIFLADNGERTIIHYTTGNQKLFDHNIKISSIKKAKVIYLGNLPEISIKERLNLVKFAKKHKILTVLNLGITDCRRPKNQLIDLLSQIDILIINGHEFAELVKAKYEDIFFNENVINHYFPLLKEKIVIITEGKRGSYGYFNNKVYYVPAIKVDKIIDTTGAGDGYCAGFISQYCKTGKIEESMKKGSEYARIILQKIGAN